MTPLAPLSGPWRFASTSEFQGRKKPTHLRVTASLFPRCGHPARIGRHAGAARGGKGDLPYRVHTMGTVNATTLPSQHANQFLTQHIVCQAAFSTTYAHNSRSGKTCPFSLRKGYQLIPQNWFYKQTQPVGRLMRRAARATTYGKSGLTDNNILLYEPHYRLVVHGVGITLNPIFF